MAAARQGGGQHEAAAALEGGGHDVAGGCEAALLG